MKSKVGPVVASGGVLLVIVALLASFALAGWVIMLLCGVLYAEFGVLKPIGFWISTGLGALLLLLAAFLRGNG